MPRRYQRGSGSTGRTNAPGSGRPAKPPAERRVRVAGTVAPETAAALSDEGPTQGRALARVLDEWARGRGRST